MDLDLFGLLVRAVRLRGENGSLNAVAGGGVDTGVNQVWESTVIARHGFYSLVEQGLVYLLGGMSRVIIIDLRRLVLNVVGVLSLVFVIQEVVHFDERARACAVRLTHGGRHGGLLFGHQRRGGFLRFNR